MSQDQNGTLPGGTPGAPGLRRRFPNQGGTATDTGNAPMPVQGGSDNPAPPTPPRMAVAPSGGGQTMTAPASQSTTAPAYSNPFTMTAPGADAGRRAIGPESRGSVATVQPGAPIGPGTPQPGASTAAAPATTPGSPMGRRALGPESRGATSQNPSPNGPSRLGQDVLKTAVGAPQGGGFQQPTWGVASSGSAGQANTPAPQWTPGGWAAGTGPQNPFATPGASNNLGNSAAEQGRRALGPESRGGFNPAAQPGTPAQTVASDAAWTGPRDSHNAPIRPQGAAAGAAGPGGRRVLGSESRGGAQGGAAGGGVSV